MFNELLLELVCTVVRYISETVIDRGIFTMEDEYKVYVLYRTIVPLSMTLTDPEPQFQGHSIV